MRNGGGRETVGNEAEYLELAWCQSGAQRRLSLKRTFAIDGTENRCQLILQRDGGCHGAMPIRATEIGQAGDLACSESGSRGKPGKAAS